MCWNASVSLQTFLFSTIPLVLCLYYGLIDIKDYFVFQTFISIQLLEYFLWTFLKDKTWNRIFSILGFILIFLLAFFTIYSSKKYNYQVLGLYILFYVYILCTIPIRFHTSVAPNHHLNWEWNNVPLYIVILWTLFLLYPCMYTIYSGGRIDNFTLFISAIYLVSFYSYYSANTFGTMWCWIANASAIYFYYLLVCLWNLSL